MTAPSVNAWATEADFSEWLTLRTYDYDLTVALGSTEIDRALRTAQLQLMSSTEFSFPQVRPEIVRDSDSVVVQTKIEASNEMVWGLFEQALFVLGYQTDFDARSALRSDGVSEAGILQEVYRDNHTIAISPYAREICSKYSRRNKFFKNSPNDPQREIQGLPGYSAIFPSAFWRRG